MPPCVARASSSSLSARFIEKESARIAACVCQEETKRRPVTHNSLGPPLSKTALSLQARAHALLPLSFSLVRRRPRVQQGRPRAAFDGGHVGVDGVLAVLNGEKRNE